RRFFFFSSRRRHTILVSDWISDVCSSDLVWILLALAPAGRAADSKKPVAKIPAAADSARAKPADPPPAPTPIPQSVFVVPKSRRSEERRVGKEGRDRGGPDELKVKRRGEC